MLVVKAEHRGSIPGIVHGSSASGASLFLEPLSTVEINNEIVALEEQEAEEVRRILLALTDAFRERADRSRSARSSVATELDVLQAQGALRAARSTASRRRFRRTAGSSCRRARHPLLMRSVVARVEQRRRSAGSPVPVDIVIGRRTTVLLITGPNTGGKTVALKTAGLLALMAQAGLHIPAAEARAAGVPIDLRRHRRRAVDRGEPEHVLVAHHEHRVDGSRAAASGAGAARRGRRGHRSDRRRRARRRHRRSLPAARRDRDRHDPLRRAQDLRVDDRRA